MDKDNNNYYNYVKILEEELVPAMGCTEPVCIAYCAAKARETLGCAPESVTVEVSGNIIKNVKSVIVPNTGGMKGIEAAAAAGITVGDASRALEVIARVPEEKRADIAAFLKEVPVRVRTAQSAEQLDVTVIVEAGGQSARVRIAGIHTNIVLVEKNGVKLYEAGSVRAEGVTLTDRSLLNAADIYDFAVGVELSDVKEVISRQIAYNTRIAEEGLRGCYGAGVGKVLLSCGETDVRMRARAMAAAGSDARMGGCELPVIINSGSGNQGMTASLPVIVYAQEYHVGEERLYRALTLSNLLTIHQKTGIGRLSAYCGAVSAGCAAGCGIAFLLGGDYETLAHTLVNSLAIVSGIVCDGAKPSCAGKIAASVDAGILGYEMYRQGRQFYAGEGLVSKGVENTILNIGRLGRVGMKETDREIIRMMTDC